MGATLNPNRLEASDLKGLRHGPQGRSSDQGGFSSLPFCGRCYLARLPLIEGLSRLALAQSIWLALNTALDIDVGFDFSLKAKPKSLCFYFFLLR